MAWPDRTKSSSPGPVYTNFWSTYSAPKQEITFCICPGPPKSSQRPWYHIASSTHTIYSIYYLHMLTRNGKKQTMQMCSSSSCGKLNCAPVVRAPQNSLPLVWPTTSKPEVHSEHVKAKTSFLLVTIETPEHCRKLK